MTQPGAVTTSHSPLSLPEPRPRFTRTHRLDCSSTATPEYRAPTRTAAGMTLLLGEDSLGIRREAGRRAFALPTASSLINLSHTPTGTLRSPRHGETRSH